MHIVISILFALTAGSSAGASEKIAVVDFATPGFPAIEGKALSDNLVGIVAAEVAALGHSVVSSSDINAMLSLEKQKELIGCTEVSCLAEIGGALGVEMMVNGSVGKLGDVFSLTLALVDTRKAEVRARFQGTAGTEAALGATAKRGVAVLVGKVVDVGGTGMIVVRTIPAGGSVFLDGKAVGTEPITLDEVIAGDHVVSATKSSLKGTMPLALVSGATERFTIQLKESAPVKIKVISTPPDARVLIDSVEKGTTPIVISDVASGEHVIRIELAGHIAYENTHVFSSDEFVKAGEVPFKIEATLSSRLELPIPLIAVAGITTNAETLTNGITAQVEVGVSTRWIEGTIGYVRPYGYMATVRGFLYHGLIDAGVLVRALEYLQPSHSHGSPSLSGGLTVGRGWDTFLGVLGVRLEGLVNKDLERHGAPLNVPLALVGYWRL